MYYWLTQYHARGRFLRQTSHFNPPTHGWEAGLGGRGPGAGTQSRAQAVLGRPAGLRVKTAEAQAPTQPFPAQAERAAGLPVSTQPALTEHFLCAGPCALGLLPPFCRAENRVPETGGPVWKGARWKSRGTPRPALPCTNSTASGSSVPARSLSFSRKTGGRPLLGLVVRREALSAGSRVAAVNWAHPAPPPLPEGERQRPCQCLAPSRRKAGQGEGCAAHFRVAGDRWAFCKALLSSGEGASPAGLQFQAPRPAGQISIPLARSLTHE